MSPNIIKAQKIPKASASRNQFEDELARFCYYFSQYTLAQARRMPLKRIQQMLRVADREYGRYMHDMIVAVRAASAKNPENVVTYFRGMAEK